MVTYFKFLFLFFLQIDVFSQIITRGPYLQIGTSSGITLVWNTNIDTDTKVWLGENYKEKKVVFESLEKTIDHIVVLKDLKPKTKYYYAIGSSDNKPIHDSTFYFLTSPSEGSKDKFRFIAFGDCGTGTSNQKLVLDKVQKYFNNDPINGWLLLGDNAYNYGFLDEYQKYFFDVYANNLLKNTVLWPSPGNHDYGGRPLWPNDWGKQPKYFDFFVLPSKGEAGGVSSGSEAYYSYNYANVHFVSLDSYGAEEGLFMADSLSKQVNWLKKDLSSNKLPWTVVYFHHPPFSKGSHDSDKELDLVAIRENLVKVLEKYKVDLVLSGHSHNYERSYFMKDHFGFEDSFDLKKHAISTSNGKYDGSENSCPYVKSDSGTVYIVAGTAGWVGGTSVGYPHNAMVYSNSSKTGALILEVEDNRFDVKYLSEDGEILDKFTMFKDVNKKSKSEIACGDLLNLGASWNDDFVWNVGKVSSKNLVIDSLNRNAVFEVSDSKRCLKDEFQVFVKPYPSIKVESNSPVPYGSTITFSTNFSTKGELYWEGPNGFISNEPLPKIDPAYLENSGIYKLKASFKNCTSQTSTEVLVLNPLGIQNESQTQIELFPNPVSNQINLKFEVPKEGYYNFDIIDNSGKEIYSKKNQFFRKGTQDFSFLFNNESMPKGLFFFKITGKELNKSLKFICN
jgi:hypothetical protein